jgi:dihydroflavonol-4-reductase
MKYLVTGASGFLGGHLILALAERGHDVRAFARSTVRMASHHKITHIRGDILTGDALREATDGCDGVFHCAGRVSRDPNDATMLWETHVVGTRRVLDTARDAGVKRVVYASTSGTIAISEDSQSVANEDTPAPLRWIERFAYYRSKFHAEAEVATALKGGLDVVTVNPSLLLGPGDIHGSSTDDVKRFVDGRIPMIPAGGVAFVDARDAAEGMILAMEKGTSGRRYLLNASNCSLADFFGRLSRLSGTRVPMFKMTKGTDVARWGAKFLGRVAETLGAEAPVDPVSAEMAQLFWYCDASRAERELGWTARDPVATLADTVKALRG